MWAGVMLLLILLFSPISGEEYCCLCWVQGFRWSWCQAIKGGLTVHRAAIWPLLGVLSQPGWERHWVSMIAGLIWPADWGWQDPGFSSSFVFPVHIWQTRGPSADDKCICCCAASQPEPGVLWWGKSKVWGTADFPGCYNAKGFSGYLFFQGWVKYG